LGKIFPGGRVSDHVLHKNKRGFVITKRQKPLERLNKTSAKGQQEREARASKLAGKK